MSLRDFALLVMVCSIWAFSNVISKLVISHLGARPEKSLQVLAGALLEN